MKQGDQAALAELYDKTSPMVYGLMVRIMGEGLAAQDALVEAYEKAWNRIHSFDPQMSGLLSWLVLLARGVALNRPEKKALGGASSIANAVEDRQTLERAFFDGVQDGDLRGALLRLRKQKKGGDAE